MQAIKLTIPGLYWDSQIYSGFLYLFGIAGEITVLNWNKVVNELPVPDKLKVARDTAFKQSDLLYSWGARQLTTDPEIRLILIQKFEHLAKLELVIELAKNKPVTQDNPMPFPHSDSDIHYSTLFVGAQSGLFTSRCHGYSKNPVDDSDQRWDAPVLDLSTSYRTVALAAGEEGLYEFNINNLKLKPVAKKDCTMCEWAFYSIYGSSHLGSGFLAAYEKVEDEESSGRRRKHFTRRFERLIPSGDLFHHQNNNGFSWGARDKFYYFKDGVIDILRYVPQPKKGQEKFKSLGQIRLQPWKGDVVSAKVAPFGSVIECDNALIVIQSDGEISTFLGEPVNWRVFPKSEHYTNQLHIIYEDRLEIISFVHDYFIDQQSKRSGINMRLSDEP
jgi:hypothetical protein